MYMENIYCPVCHSDKKLGVISHEVITIAPDSNTEKYPIHLPVSMRAVVKCFECGAEFLTCCSLDFEVNPF